MLEINREEGIWYVWYDTKYIGYLVETDKAHVWSMCFVLIYPISTQIEILQKAEKLIADMRI